MIIITLLVLLVAIGRGGAPPIFNGCPTEFPQDLDFHYINTLDLEPYNLVINATEIDAFVEKLHAYGCLPASVNVTGADLVTQCDADLSGDLSEADWNWPTGCVGSQAPVLGYLCELLACYNERYISKK